ncbi:MAG: hypothetical protein ABI670_03855 [Chloroflexota bacterium]
MLLVSSGPTLAHFLLWVPVNRSCLVSLSSDFRARRVSTAHGRVSAYREPLSLVFICVLRAIIFVPSDFLTILFDRAAALLSKQKSGPYLRAAPGDVVVRVVG